MAASEPCAVLQRSRRWPWVAAVAALAVAAAGLVGSGLGATAAPVLVWCAADTASADDEYDIRTSPDGSRDPGRWRDSFRPTRDEGRRVRIDRWPPPESAVRRMLDRMTGVVCRLTGPRTYVGTDLAQHDASGTPWSAFVSEDVDARLGSPSRRLTGRWDVGWDDEPRRTFDFLADGTLRAGRFDGRWSVVADALVLDLTAWDDPPFIARGAALVAEDGLSFDGASVEPRVRVFRGRRVND